MKKYLAIVLSLAFALPMFISCSQTVSAYGYEVLSAEVMNSLSASMGTQEAPTLPEAAPQEAEPQTQP